MKKHLFLLFLALLMAIAPARADKFSAVTQSGHTLYYNIINGNNAEVTYENSSSPRYSNLSGALEIPSSVNYNGQDYSVTSIGNYAFRECSGLTSVIIPNSVTSIGNYAFRECSGLTSVTIGSHVESIGSYAFYNCTGLKSVTIPESVTSIGSYAFSNVHTVINCDDNITGSPWGALNAGCFCSDGDFIYFDDTKTVLVGYLGAGGNVTIPESVTSIGNNAFSGCIDLTRVTIGSHVTSIGDYAFYKCTSLDSVTIPDNVNSIGSSAFRECSGLTRVTIGSHVESISTQAFSGCTRLDSVTIPNSVTSIGISAFQSCSGLTSVTIPSSVTSIGNSAFNGCSSLTDVTLPGSVTRIGDNAFRSCSKLESVNIPDSVKTIGDYAFQSCTSLKSVTIPDSVKTIGDEAFHDCSKLESVTIGNSVTSIGYRFFYNCSKLTSVTIGSHVESIGIQAFSGCSDLTSVNIPSSVTTIGNSAFNNCSSLTNVTIGSHVTSIGSSAFFNCSGLRSIVLTGSVNNIGSRAFNNCSNLKTVFNLSSLTLTTGSEDHGQVAKYAKRVVVPTTSGSGNNAIYQIPDTYSFVDVENNVPNEIPRNAIPTNFIYKDGGEWKAKEIVLTDDTCRFNAPVEFTAASVTYTRTLTDGNRSTLCLPFTTTIPNNLEVYEFTSFDSYTIHFTAYTDSIKAYKPYLVGKGISKSTTDFTFTQDNAVFPATPASMTLVTHNDMTFQGVMERTQMSSTNNYGYKDGYFVRSGGSAHVNPFRCYFTWSNAPQNAPQNLDIDTDGGEVGIEQPAADDAAQNGHIRYSNDVYDLMGRMVRKEASDLRGLPKGIYIWRGKKVMAF